MVEKAPSIGWGVVIGSAVWGLMVVTNALLFAEGIPLLVDIEATLREIRNGSPAGHLSHRRGD